MSNPFQVVKDFEAALCEYTGAPYAVTVNSCTMALLLACKYYLQNDNEKLVSIPNKTYVSVPQSIIHAGGRVHFSSDTWEGLYQLKPYPIWDSARYFTENMYTNKYCAELNAPEGSGVDKIKILQSYSGSMMCVSFHSTKILGDTQGGAILHDSKEADTWLRKARFDGRTEGVHPKSDHFDMLGYHCYMSPDVAARLLHKLSVLPKHNPPLPNDPYPDLSQFEVLHG